MAKRNIIHIDEEKCDGCGLCADACHEGAIQIVGGKAKLVSETYCDGLGDCIGECPQGAITIEEREAADFDEEAVRRRLAERDGGPPVHACPGSAARELRPVHGGRSAVETGAADAQSLLGHWPVLLMLVPPAAPFFKGANLVICADCVPFAFAGFHERYLRDSAVVVGCPKFDDIAYYYEKLKDIFRLAGLKSITVVRMEVPCCGGLAQAVRKAREETVPDTPLEVHTIGIQGEIKDVTKF
ncbi:4Fe-4S binding protein [bacterium]|nr:4Fe-4S binding protein [bacterium]